MNVKRVSARRAVGPARDGELFTADNRTKSLEKNFNDARLYWGQCCPLPTKPDDAVLIERRDRWGRCIRTVGQGGESGLDFYFVSRDPNPVLKWVDDFWGACSRFDQQQPRSGGRGQTIASIAFGGPTNKNDIHDTVDRTDGVLRVCFVPMNRCRTCRACPSAAI